jgi:hypothetical protein
MGTLPSGNHGMVLEYISAPTLLSADLTPVVDGYDGKPIPDGNVPVSITNLSGTTRALSVGLTWVRTE